MIKSHAMRTHLKQTVRIGVSSRFVEREVDKPYPHNGHLTQVLWVSDRSESDTAFVVLVLFWLM